MGLRRPHRAARLIAVRGGGLKAPTVLPDGQKDDGQLEQWLNPLFMPLLHDQSDTGLQGAARPTLGLRIPALGSAMTIPLAHNRKRYTRMVIMPSNAQIDYEGYIFRFAGEGTQVNLGEPTPTRHLSG